MSRSQPQYAVQIVERLRDIERRLLSSDGDTVARLAAAHDVSTKTIRRDLGALEVLGLRLQCSSPQGGSHDCTWTADAATRIFT